MLSAGYGSGHFQEKKRGKLYFKLTFSKYIHWRRRVLISQTNNELLCIILVIHTFYPSCFSEGEGGIIYFINFCNKIINPYNFLRPHGSKVWNKLKKTLYTSLLSYLKKKTRSGSGTILQNTLRFPLTKKLTKRESRAIETQIEHQKITHILYAYQECGLTKITLIMNSQNALTIQRIGQLAC